MDASQHIALVGKEDIVVSVICSNNLRFRKIALELCNASLRACTLKPLIRFGIGTLFRIAQIDCANIIRDREDSECGDMYVGVLLLAGFKLFPNEAWSASPHRRMSCIIRCQHHSELSFR